MSSSPACSMRDDLALVSRIGYHCRRNQVGTSISFSSEAQYDLLSSSGQEMFAEAHSSDNEMVRGFAFSMQDAAVALTLPSW